MFGKGIYFANNASLSCIGYGHPLNGAQQGNEGTYQVLLADVAVGLTDDAGAGGGKYADCMECPQGFDSVMGNVGGSDVYVIYENVKAYPRYLVQFKYIK